MRSGSGFRADLRNFTDIAGYRETAARRFARLLSTYRAPADDDPVIAWAQHHRSGFTSDHEELT